MPVLICGSLAYDNIMVFPDRFKNHILPDKIHMLNVSFLVPELRREFGGCAGNIAYNLNMLGTTPIIMATAGSDFGPYAEWLDECRIRRENITIIDDELTAQAFITTDLDDNQITAFHPGAMNLAHVNRIEDATDLVLGIISPDGRDGMIQHAEQMVELEIPFIFDPGQGMPMFNGDELKNFIEQATWVTVNDYEWQMMQERTGWGVEDVIQRVDALIVTRGGEGSTIYRREETLEIPAVKPAEICDPTGCGDAYRAGLLHGLRNNLDWETTGRIASLMGAIKIEKHGTQNHVFSKPEFKSRYKKEYGTSFLNC